MLDLLEATAACIRTHNPRLAEEYKRDFKQWIVRTGIVHLTPLQQLNKYWFLELGLLDCNTVDARECLQDGIDVDVWINNFSIYVMPFISYYEARSRTGS